MILLLLLCACDDPAHPDAGTWAPVAPPPGAPAGTTCWVWSDCALGVDSYYGGPVCFVLTTTGGPR